MRPMVVIIPGILGSVLSLPDDTAVFGPGRTGMIRAGISPQVLRVEDGPDLVATDVVRSMMWVPPFAATSFGYGDLIDAVTAQIPNASVVVSDARDPNPQPADVVIFPYDFRLGVVHAAQRLRDDLTARLKDLTASAKQRRVVVIAHSMGGLVARYWLACLGGAACCRALISVGVPHRGSPSALQRLVQGVGRGPVTFTTATEVLRGWTSLYDLLPRYPMIDHAGSHLHPHELPETSVPARFPDKARDAFGMHQDIATGWDRLGNDAPQVVCLFARGHATLAHATLTGSTWHWSRQDPPWLPNPGWRGDATVPAIASIPPEDDEARPGWRPIPQRHRRMPSAPAIIDVLLNYLGDSLHAALAPGDDETPWLGLDVDDEVLDDEPVTVTAQLHRAATADGLWVRVFDPSTGAKIRDQRMSGDGPDHTAVLDPLPAGLYRVEVVAVGVPRVDRVVCDDLLAVLSHDDDTNP
jgi:hypothetical protein